MSLKGNSGYVDEKCRYKANIRERYRTHRWVFF